MLGVYFCLSLFYVKCYSKNALYFDEQHISNSILCITDTVEKYFSEEKTLTYVDMNSDDYEILKAIHLSTVTTMVFRQATSQSYFKHQGYLINAKSAMKFVEYFKYLLEDPTWNPSSRFIIVNKSLHGDELKKIFDELLKRHVVNVLVVNGTDNAHLYTYNPFDNYACGKYYNNVISYGLCLNTTRNLFPNKYVTGLRNCTLLATVPHRPPYSIHPHLADDKRRTLGAEQYLFKVIGELEHFTVNFSYDRSNELTTITSNMTVIGPMVKLQNNDIDAMLGRIVLVSNKADAFTYLHGYMDYYDELNFFVKKAALIAVWKNAYLVFYPLVWGLLLLVYLAYSSIMIILLHAKDKTNIMLNMFKLLLLSGGNVRYHRMNSYVRCIFIIWVWFATLMNSHYQSSLLTLIRKPLKDNQVLDEADIVRHNLMACVEPRVLENIHTNMNIFLEVNISKEIKYDCLDTIQILKKVAQSENIFTLVPHSVYRYYKKSFCDAFGNLPLYYFKKPYVKLIVGIFFYKGFPLSDRMRITAVRLRETGLVYKKFKDFYYARSIQSKFQEKGFESRLVIPWFIYVIGCFLSTIVFIIELLFIRFSL